MSSEQLAGLTSLFDDIVVRARRDLALEWVDEVTLFDPSTGRFVVWRVPIDGSPRFFLVLQVPARSTWRKHSNKLIKELAEWLANLPGANLNARSAAP